jgi:DNA invertase Pin-like site-specific DNA recombinase
MAPEGAATRTKEQGPVKVVYCLYARKSTESEEQQVLSIESQVKEMLKIAERDGLEIADIRRESHSAKDSGQRPVFVELLKDIREGKFNGVLTWAPDRLSRNAGDLGSLVDLMDQKLLVNIRTFSQTFSNSPSEKFMLMIMCSQAKLENDNKSENVKRGLRTRCEMGLRPGVAPTGYFNEKRLDRKCQVIVDPERAPLIKQMFEKVAYEQWTGRHIYHWLRHDLDFKTKTGKYISLGNIYLILRATFYYGVFEYPEGSGNWYTGVHTPLISKDLYDKVQTQLIRSEIKKKNREFAFARLIACGLCGSSMCASEKFKQQKNGNVHRYIYYGCSRGLDKTCKAGYIKEEEILRQLIEIVDTLDMNELGIRHKFRDEVARYGKFRKMVLGKDKETADGLNNDADLRTYVKYLLSEGTILEKRDVLANLKSRLVFRDEKISLQK